MGEGKKVLLGETETLPTEAKAEGTQELSISEDHVLCKSMSYPEKKEGKELEHDIKGSTAPNPGTGGETIAYGECEVKGASSCLINGEGAGKGKIETEPLKNTLVFKTKEAAEKEESKTLTLLEPKSTVFTKVTFSGTCPRTGTFELDGGALLAIDVNGAEESKIQKLEFPKTAITSYFRNVSKKTEEVKIKAPGLEGKDPASYAIVGIGGVGIAGLFIAVLIFN